MQQGSFSADWMSAETLEDLKWRLNKWSDHFFRNLTHLNVKKLYTEYCSIRSEAGETQIIGPLINMWDKQSTPELRLCMGYDKTSSEFLFNLYDTDGNQTVSLTSAGQFQLSGKPLISMYDTSTLRLKMGYDSLTSTWGFNLYDTSGNETVSLSSTGHFQLTGKPLIQMYDTSTLRLKMGYDSVLNSWGFNMYDVYGNGTVAISSTGQFQLGGMPLISMYDIASTLRLKMGYDSGSWVYEMYNAAGVKTIGVDGSGNGTIDSGTITGGTIRTAASGERIEMSSNSLKTYSSAENLMGPVWGTGWGGDWGDLSLYSSGTEVLRFENQGFEEGYTIKPMNGALLGLGAAGAVTNPFGTWDFQNVTSVSGLETDTHTQGNHNHGIPDGTPLMVDGGGVVIFNSSGGFSHKHAVKKA